jgi:hypothetical protein
VRRTSLAPGVALCAAVAAWGAAAASAVVTPASAPPPPGGAEPPAESATCAETFPAGSARPKVVESFPARGKSGYALVLDLVIEHGKGETVLPSGLGGKGASEGSHALEAAGFYLPSAKGDSRTSIETKIEGDRARTHLTIPLVALPKKPGRAELDLPPLPIAMARASGEVRTFCTQPHHVTLEDPIANTPDARPRGNPKPLRQVEEWTAAKNAAIGALVALAVAALATWLFRIWSRRPKPVPPPPPPRPPWDVALEELFDVRIAQLVEQGRFAEHFDRVSDAVRRYLGARYGFDGLETTTHEAMVALRKVTPRIGVLADVEAFLRDADLVKFAKITPTEAECHGALEGAEGLVRRTMPQPEPQPIGASAPTTGGPSGPRPDAGQGAAGAGGAAPGAAAAPGGPSSGAGSGTAGGGGSP